MIDEIDKMGADFRGDPSSAMLEVLDPEQNSHASATTTWTCRSTSRRSCSSPPRTSSTRSRAPLRDRMEMIELSGYTEEEKLEIAKRYLVPRQMEQNGAGQVEDRVHRRGAARADRGLHARGRRAQPRARDRRDLPQGRARVRRGQRASPSAPCGRRRSAELLGKRRFQPETWRAAPASPGVATGLAWTPVGGDVLFVEATALPGRGQAQVTGQLGDVMKESAPAALSYVRHDVRAARRRRARRLVPRERRARARARGRDPQGRPERRHHDGHRAGLAGHRPAGARRHRDDRRDHADRPGAADRRPQGEGAGGPARGDQARDRAAAKRGRRSTSSRPTC